MVTKHNKSNGDGDDDEKNPQYYLSPVSQLSVQQDNVQILATNESVHCTAAEIANYGRLGDDANKTAA